MATEIPRTTEHEFNDHIIAGLFHDDKKAQNALQRLRDLGIPETHIGVAASKRHEKKHFWERARKSLGEHDEVTSGPDFRRHLVEQGVSEGQARYFNDRLTDGSVLITVHVGPERDAEVRRVLGEAEADLGTDVGRTPTLPTEREFARTGTTLHPEQTPGENHIQLLGERLRISKEKIARGDVTLRKEVVTEPQRVEVPVTHEEVVIERHAASGAVPEGGIGKKEDIRIPVSEERVKVEKVPEVREEVTARTKPIEETKEISDTTRREELRVEKKDRAEVEEIPPNKKDRAA